MGNWLRKTHDANLAQQGEYMEKMKENDEGKKKKLDETSNKLRLKVVMSRDRFEELVTRANLSGSSGDSDKLGFLIFKECFEGKFCGRVVPAGENLSLDKYGVVRSLSSIKEE